MGYDKFIADLMFVYVIGVMDWQETEPAFFDWVYKMGLSITSLHPRYSFVYYALSTYLSFKPEAVPLSNAILERGAKEFPNDVNMPFYIAFNFYWVLKDKKAAVPYFAEACRRPSASPHMCTLAAKLILEDQADPEEVAQLVAMGYCLNASPERANNIRVDFESRILPRVEDPAVRRRLRERFERQIALCQARQEKKS